MIKNDHLFKSLSLRNVVSFLRNTKNEIRLTYYLIRDPEISFLLKLPVLLSLFYLILPFDLFSDYFIPGLGYIDDFFILMWAMRFFLNHVPYEMKQKYSRYC